MADLRLTSLRRGEAEIWFLDLRLPADLLGKCTCLLSAEERERMARFRFEQLRNRYAAGRGALRALLGHYVGMQPSDFRFATGPAGKPFIHAPECARGLEFNVAHCDDMAVIAVSKGLPLGVDIERVRLLPDAAQLARHFFCPAETKLYLALPPAQQPQAFFNLWTRKEALLKATGEGIAHSLNRVEVSLAPGERAVIRDLPASFGLKEQWSLTTLDAPAGWAATLAAMNPSLSIRHQYNSMETLDLVSRINNPATTANIFLEVTAV